MKIKLRSVFLDDQDKALKFYTNVLGFVKKLDFPMEKFKWLTVVSPEKPDGTQATVVPTATTEDQNLADNFRIPHHPTRIGDMNVTYPPSLTIAVFVSTNAMYWSLG